MKKATEYDIFVSYRRTASESAALIVEKLRSMGYRVFYDVESMRSGKFNEQLYTVIEQCRDFVIVLPENALDRCNDPEDWVRKEIEHAMASKKNIIPVILRGFQWPCPMPQGLEELQYFQAVVASTDMFDLAMKRLAEYLKSKPYTLIKRKYIRRLILVVSVALFLLVTFYSLRLFAVPACRIVACKETNQLGCLDFLLETKDKLAKEWDSFVEESRKLATSQDTERYETLKDGLSRNLDYIEKDVVEMKEYFKRCDIAPSSGQNILLGTYGILGLELSQSSILCESIFDEVERVITHMRNVSDTGMTEWDIQSVALDIKSIKPSAHSMFYAICELLSRLPKKVLNDFYEASSVFHNLPNGVGLEHSRDEYMRFYEKEINEYKDILNQMKRLTGEMTQELIQLETSDSIKN